MGLTPRELEVIELVSQGMTNPEIARSLIVSINTVKTHLAHIYKKTGINNKICLASWYVREFELNAA